MTKLRHRIFFLMTIVFTWFSLPIISCAKDLAYDSSKWNISVNVQNKHDNPYAPFSDFAELYSAYEDAVEQNDIFKQKFIYSIAERTLNEEIAMSESMHSVMYDADQRYWQQQFWNYFSAGQFITRSNGVALELTHRGATSWTVTQKANAWQSVCAKFRNDYRWKNESVMKQQFYCHARKAYAAMRSSWHLEPWRTSINVLTCNDIW